MRSAIALFLLAATPATAQTVTSPRAERVSVTVYRNPDRGSDGAMELRWLRGFALITETRTITVPTGTSEIRFEGVAGGILPQSAIVTGLPHGVGEKNRDARLLSPGALLDGHLGRRVHLRRTNRATGQVREMDAVVRAGPGNGVVLETEAGIEALGCSGLPETLVYDHVPEGLSDKPTLAVKTEGDGGTATITLSYLADGFDWQANYVAQIAADGRTLDLFGWLTFANGNAESFPDAQTQAVAGRLARERNRPGSENDGIPMRINLQCWPMETTSDIAGPVPPPPPSPPPPAPMAVTESIVVTAQRAARSPAAMMAEQEELGDLKLYRIPEPVSIAANGMKQVALLDRRGVPFDRLYTATLSSVGEIDPSPAMILLRTRNAKDRGLGLPLPSGKVSVFENGRERTIWVGEPGMGDLAVGQDIELELGPSPRLHYAQRALDPEMDGDPPRKSRRFEITLSNAGDAPAVAEIGIERNVEWRMSNPSAKLREKNGRPTWFVTIPPGAAAQLRYTARRTR